MKKNKNVRLPKHVVPQRYRIMIRPDLKGFSFYGEETIYLTMAKPVSEITLHSKDLDIYDVSLKNSKSKIQISKQKLDRKNETITFVLPKRISKGRAELTLKFRGVLNDKMRGFYRSKYQHEGKNKHLATTQFEATDARRAFPCIDEPAAKAVFDITLMVPKGVKAISNTIETEILEHESGYQVVKFAPTPKMSTYLVAFIVGEFDFIEGKTRDGVLVRVFVTPGKKHQAKFALDVATRVLEFYNKYFDIPYPLQVLDLIAIPDFSHGAMENWGAVTYRESALLVDPQHSSAANKQWVALVIAHELAHQWFGNLVTMEWWTHLWLNEGFASYIEYLAVNHLFPKWDIWTQFASQDLGVALDLDALKNTHPIEVEVHHPDEIGEIFDEVSYSKGACLIRMLADYLGEKDFRDGLRYYLKKHSFGNASTGHLWQALEKISNKPVRKIMKNWTQKPGYPLLKVLETKGGLELLQSRFYSSELSKNQSNDKTVWQIPVLIRTSQSNKIQKELMTGRELVVQKPKADWLKINAGETGLLRTAYPPEMLESLEIPIKQKKLDALDRLGLLRDAFALTEAGELPTTEALSLAGNYTDETDYNVIVELTQGLGTIENLISGEKYREIFKDYCKALFTPMAKRLGWQKQKHESHTQGLLRSLALFEAGHYGDLPTIKTAQGLFKKPYIDPDVRSVVYALSAENGQSREFKALLNRYQREQLHEERGRLGRALAAFRNTELIKQALNFSISGKVRLQDAPMIIVSAWVNPLGKEMVWEFLQKNWAWFLEHFPGSGHMLSRLVKPASKFASNEKAEEILRFFKIHSAPGISRTIQQTVENIRSNAMWLSRERQHIGNWLDEWNKNKK